MLSQRIATLKVACLLDADISSGGTAKTSGIPDALLRAHTRETPVLIVTMLASDRTVETFVPSTIVPSESQGHCTFDPVFSLAEHPISEATAYIVCHALSSYQLQL